MTAYWVLHSRLIYFWNIKGALDKFNIIPPTFFQKSWDFYTIRSVDMGNDCMLHAEFYCLDWFILEEIWI